MEILIRKAVPGDAGEIAVLFEAYRDFYNRPPDLTGAVRYLRARLERQEALILVARLETGKAVGFVQMYPTFDSLAMQPAWILYDLYVDPHVRRRAVGRRLMAQAAEHARRSGASYIALETAADNQPARALYESLGYRQDPEFLNYTLALQDTP